MAGGATQACLCGLRGCSLHYPPVQASDLPSANVQNINREEGREVGAEEVERFRNKACSKDSILDKVRIMPKVTSKLQLTVPKKIADQYGIRPGDELEWIPAGESIRVELVRRKAKAGHELTTKERLALFDANMERIDKLQAEQLKEARKNNTRITR